MGAPTEPRAPASGPRFCVVKLHQVQKHAPQTALWHSKPLRQCCPMLVQRRRPHRLAVFGTRTRGSAECEGVRVQRYSSYCLHALADGRIAAQPFHCAYHHGWIHRECVECACLGTECVGGPRRFSNAVSQHVAHRDGLAEHSQLHAFGATRWLVQLSRGPRGGCGQFGKRRATS